MRDCTYSLLWRTRGDFTAAGSAELAGHDVTPQPREVRQAIGLVFQDQSLDDRLTAEVNLRFHAMLYNVPSAVADERIDQVLAMVVSPPPIS